jgi:hypothetical protein
LALDEVDDQDINTSNGDEDNLIDGQQDVNDEGVDSKNDHYISDVDK